MRLLFVFLLSLSNFSFGQADNIQRPQPVDINQRNLVHRSIDVSYDLVPLFSNKALTLYTAETLPTQLKNEKYKDRTFVNLAKLAQSKNGKSYVLGSNEWVAFDLKTSRLHMHVDEKLAALFKARFMSESVVQIKIQGRLVSVTRQKDPFSPWNIAKIKAADPIEVLQFSLITRSGEKCILSIPTKEGDDFHHLELEATLSDNYSILDLRIYLFNTLANSNLGMEYSSGLTLQTGHDFIQPIGISTDPERLTVLILRPEVINAKGEIISPLE